MEDGRITRASNGEDQAGKACAGADVDEIKRIARSRSAATSEVGLLQRREHGEGVFDVPRHHLALRRHRR